MFNPNSDQWVFCHIVIQHLTEIEYAINIYGHEMTLVYSLTVELPWESFDEVEIGKFHTDHSLVWISLEPIKSQAITSPQCGTKSLLHTWYKWILGSKIQYNQEAIFDADYPSLRKYQQDDKGNYQAERVVFPYFTTTNSNFQFLYWPMDCLAISIEQFFTTIDRPNQNNRCPMVVNYKMMLLQQHALDGHLYCDRNFAGPFGFNGTSLSYSPLSPSAMAGYYEK